MQNVHTIAAAVRAANARNVARGGRREVTTWRGRT